MLVALLYWAILVTEGAYPATHWVVNNEGKIQAQVSSVNEESLYSLYCALTCCAVNVSVLCIVYYGC